MVGGRQGALRSTPPPRSRAASCSASPRASRTRSSTRPSSPPSKGKVAGPVKTDAGYYVFRVTKVTKATKQSLEQSKQGIRQLLVSQKQQKELDQFSTNFRNDWRTRTDCAEDYVIADCRNGREPTQAATPPVPPGQPKPVPGSSGANPPALDGTGSNLAGGNGEGTVIGNEPAAAAGAAAGLGGLAGRRRRRRRLRSRWAALPRRAPAGAPRRRAAGRARRDAGRRRRPGAAAGPAAGRSGSRPPPPGRQLTRRMTSASGDERLPRGAARARRDHAPPAARVPLGPRAGRAQHRPAHRRGGLRAGRRGALGRRREAAGRARRRAVPGLLPLAAARGARRGRPRRGGDGDAREAGPPPPAHLRRARSWPELPTDATTRRRGEAELGRDQAARGPRRARWPRRCPR